jgi:CRISPR-associated protein Cas1
MPTACIIQPDSRIHLESERLIIKSPQSDTGTDQVLREIPIRDLDRLIMAEGVHITSYAMAALLRAYIPVNILGWNGQFLGGFIPATNAHGLARLLQYEKTIDSAFGMEIARRIVLAKIYNQRRVLQRLAAGRSDKPQGDVPTSPVPNDTRASLDWLDSIFQQAKKCSAIDELRGCEGVSTARYFQVWSQFLPEKFPFERRSTRPPLNAVNACISFGSTILYSEITAFIHAHGIDPALGLLHSTEDGRWSLALDLLEPFRPVLVEALALDLFSHQILGKEQFEPKNGGIYLNDDGRRKFFLQYERRMERQFMSESAGHRTNLRQQVENQVVLYKSALHDIDKFEPFLIN